MNHDPSKSTHSMSHLWIMLACCLVPVIGIFAIGAFGLSLGGLQSLLPYVMVLLCPLMMIFMMRGMGNDHAATSMPSTHLAQSRAEETTTKAPATQESCH